ncbi:MAG: NUDIX domain-containing protein, partial [Clostridiales bacterium]|nr:NUDIX domain-containing protein [Clostridiales bacterium]
VGSIAFGLSTPAIDGNLMRILSRAFELYVPVGAQLFAILYDNLKRVYPPDASSFTQSFMDLGATVCLPKNPKCELCPLHAICLAHKNGTTALLPVRKEKKPRPVEKHTVFVLRQGNTVAVQKRPDSGLLRGMWELPHVDGWLDEEQAAEALANMGVHFTGAVTMRHVKHVFTHLTWELRVYDGEADDLTSFTARDKNEVALPTAFRICLGENN